MHHIFVILINQPEYVLSLRSDGECIKKKTSQEKGKKISFLLLNVSISVLLGRVCSSGNLGLNFLQLLHTPAFYSY